MPIEKERKRRNDAGKLQACRGCVIKCLPTISGACQRSWVEWWRDCKWGTVDGWGQGRKENGGWGILFVVLGSCFCRLWSSWVLGWAWVHHWLGLGCSVLVGLFLTWWHGAVDKRSVNGNLFCCSSAHHVDLFMYVSHECCRCPLSNFHDGCGINSLVKQCHCPLVHNECEPTSFGSYPLSCAPIGVRAVQTAFTMLELVTWVNGDAWLFQ